MDSRALKARVERLRSLRVRPGQDPSVGRLVDAVAEDVLKVSRRLGSAGAVWGEVCPAELAASTLVESLSRGVLTIRVADAPARFELDRWLRTGGERAVIGASRAPIRKVKLVMGPLDDGPRAA